MWGMSLHLIVFILKKDITWKMNDILNSKNKFLNLINLHLLWQLFLKTSTWSPKKKKNQ
jgi:Na+/alanine symporter